MDVQHLRSSSTPPRVRSLRLLIPLTWPGVVYGLWQRRRSFWGLKPWACIERWWGSVVRHPAMMPSVIVLGRLACLSVGIYGLVVSVGPLVADLFQPAVPGPVVLDPVSVVVPSLESTLTAYVIRLGLPSLALTFVTSGLLSMRWSFGRAGSLVGAGIAIDYVASVLGMR